MFGDCGDEVGVWGLRDRMKLCNMRRSVVLYTKEIETTRREETRRRAFIYRNVRVERSRCTHCMEGNG